MYATLYRFKWIQMEITKTLIFLFFVSGSLFAQNNSNRTLMTKKYDQSTNLVVWPSEFNPENSKFYVYNEIEINVTPEVVWNILIDAKQWHTFYNGVQSPVEFFDSSTTTLNSDVKFKMHTMNLRLEPIMKEFVTNERMAWEVRRKNLRAYHAWIIVPTENGCRLITPESQNGFLTFLQKLFQPNKLLKLHDVWLKEIKEKAKLKTR
jgi:hypothetical protein